ncbi:MAG: alpha/beta hydrolase [Porticoccaceae bacterium]
MSTERNQDANPLASVLGLARQQLEQLRASMPILKFEASLDSQSPNPERDWYLGYYGLELPEDLAVVQYRMGRFPSAGFEIATHYWVPENPRGTYLVVHGYFDHIGLYGHLIRYLLRRGYAVVAFDLPGHGLSSGERVSIESFDHYVDVFSDLLHHCEAHFPKPWKAVGQSTGGAILIKYVMAAKPHHYPNDLAQVTVLAPLIRPRDWIKSLRTFKVFHKVLRKVSRTFRPNTANELFNDFLMNADPLQYNFIPLEWVASMKRWTEEFAALPPCDYPLRVVQGDCDATVDWRYNLAALRRKFVNLQVDVIQGAQHHLVNEATWLRDRVFKALGED